MGQSQNSGWAEWSVEDESNVRDRELWYLTKSSFGTIRTEGSILDRIYNFACWVCIRPFDCQ